MILSKTDFDRLKSAQQCFLSCLSLLSYFTKYEGPCTRSTWWACHIYTKGRMITSWRNYSFSFCFCSSPLQKIRGQLHPGCHSKPFMHLKMSVPSSWAGIPEWFGGGVTAGCQGVWWETQCAIRQNQDSAVKPCVSCWVIAWSSA